MPRTKKLSEKQEHLLARVNTTPEGIAADDYDRRTANSLVQRGFAKKLKSGVIKSTAAGKKAVA